MRRRAYHPFIRFMALAAILLGCVASLAAQKKNFRFNYYTSDDGLSQNMVDCIFQDSRGFMWFGTWNGLNRFDGYTFRTYSPRDQGEFRLGSIFIHDIAEDAFGNLWIGTADGLNVYLYERDCFLQHTHEQGNDSTISSNQVHSLLVDDEGVLWAGTDRGLDRITLDGSGGDLLNITHYREPPGLEPGDELAIHDIYQDHSGRIWAGTDQGLALLDPVENSMILYSYQPGNEYSISSNDVQSILQDRQGTLWIGTNYGLNRFETGSNRFYRYFHDPGNEPSLVHNSVEDIAEDSQGNLVFGTLGGISIYQREEEIFHNYTYNSRAVTELNNEFVNCLYADGDGNVWIGTERGGVNQFNVHQNEFEYYVSIPGVEQSLSSNTINSVWEDEEALWVGTAGGGLNRIGHADGRYVHYRADASGPGSISSDFVTCIHRDIAGNLLVGTWGEGLNILTPGNERSGTFINLREEPGNDSSLVNNFISSMVEDRYGIVWIGTFGGIAAYHPGSGWFSTFGGESSIPVTRVGCLEFDRYSNLWAGTEEGLYFIPAGNDPECHLDFSRVTKYLPREAPGSISGKYVISIQGDRYGNLWVGTYGNGLNKLGADQLDRSDRQFVCYSDRHGLCNNTIYGIQEDRSGNLWLSTDNGLSRFNPESERFTNYYVVDGLLHNQFYWSASFRNSSGELYFGSMRGLLSFDPGRIREHAVHPDVILTDFKIHNQPVHVGEAFYDQVAIEKPVCMVEKIILSHQIREFSLDFSALYYEHPDKVFYAYKMVGFDDDWHYVSSRRRFASYTNLKGGDYTFQVKASLEEGYFESEPFKLEISILPPFWLKPWFIVALVLILVTSVISYNRFRVFSLRRRQKELEQLVAERTAQIRGQKEQLEQQNTEILQQRDKLMELNKKVQQSNQEQMRFFTHMSHEFRTPLTLIITPLEQMIREVSSRNPQYRTLLLMKRNAQRLLHLVNQLMEVRRIKTGKMELKASKSELVGFLENITQSFYGLANQKEIIFEFSAHPGRLTSYFDRDKIENILYNLLSNAFKYTPEGGQIIVSVRKVKHKVSLRGDVTIIGPAEHRQHGVDEYAEISVMDTGYGIEADELKKIFRRFFRIPVTDVPGMQGTGIGLYLTKELIRTHKGQLYINSKKGEGTTFTVLIPLGSGFLSLEEITEPAAGSGGKDVPKLHVDLLAGQIQQQKTAPEPRISEANNTSRSDARVLVIDDDMDMLHFTAGYLGESFHVITAHDGLEGLEKVRQCMPDLIISDILMPGLDGLELCAHLKSDIMTSHIPIILLTSRSEVEDFLEGMEYGALDYIAKPFEIEILEAKVRNLINNQERLKKLYTSTRMEDLINARKVKVQDHFLQKVIRTVEEHMNNHQFGVKELADELCISRSLLHKKLISTVDQSANNFINSIRLKRAAMLLLEGDRKVSEIAFEVGFNDPKYFSKIFKKHFGKTPSEFVEANIAANTQFST